MKSKEALTEDTDERKFARFIIRLVTILALYFTVPFKSFLLLKFRHKVIGVEN